MKPILLKLVDHWHFIAGGGVILLFILYVTDRLRKRYKRRCKKCGCFTQARMCSMVELELNPGDSFGDGHRRFQVHIFRICIKCNAVAYRSTERHFSRFQLWWKHKTEPQVFQRYPELFTRAGVVDPLTRVEKKGRRAPFSPPWRRLSIDSGPPPDAPIRPRRPNQ